MFPLAASDLELWLGNGNELAHQLGGSLAMEVPGRLMSKVFERKVENIRRNPGAWMWCTYWAIATNDAVVIGLAGFKGLARRRREAEVGYGIEPPYRGRGFMKEALALLLDWAERTGKVDRVVARTDSANHASIRVLQECDFALDYREGEQLVWVRSLVAGG